MTALENEFSRYFLNLSDDELDLVSVEKVLDDCQNQFLELKNDLEVRDVFDEESIAALQLLVNDSYSKVAERAIHILLPFVSIYLCESDISTSLEMKTNQRGSVEL